MEEKSTQQYTFGIDEKEILEILVAFEEEFSEIKENQRNEIDELRYYESFDIGVGKLSGVFLTREQDANGKISYHLYFQSPSNEILSIDHNGNIEMNPNWKEVVGEIDLEKCIRLNDREEGRLKGISEKTTPDKIAENLKKQKEDEEQEKESPEEQIQRDIGGEEDLEIGHYRAIKDNNFNEQIGIDISGYTEIGLAYSKSKNAFILIGQKNGKFEQVEGFEQAKPTYKTVISIDEKGENVEKKVPHALMKTSNSKKELSITIGQYGYIEVGTIDRLPGNERFEMQVKEENEGKNGVTDYTLRQAVKAEGIEAFGGVDDWVDAAQTMKNGEKRRGDIAQEISDADLDEYIPGTNKTWQEFANECGYRGDNGIDHAKEIFKEAREDKENSGKSNKELVEEISEDILAQSRGPKDRQKQ